MPIAPQPLTRERRSRPHRRDRLDRTDSDPLDSHSPILAAATGPANLIAGRRVAAADGTDATESPAHAAVRVCGVVGAVTSAGGCPRMTDPRGLTLANHNV